MPTNDQVILDQILTESKAAIGNDLTEGEYFEIFCAEQILKDSDLSYDELKSGIVAGANDGGIDAIYIFINGELVQEDTDLSVFKKDVVIDVIFIQAKRSAGFGEEPLHKLRASSEALLDLSNDLSTLGSVYSAPLLEIMQRFRDTHKALATKFPKLCFHYFYTTRGTEVPANVARKQDDVIGSVKKLFSSADVEFHFVGASDLLALARKKPSTTFVLNLAENPISSAGSEGFICLSKLRDYFKFMTDEAGNLQRNIFDANVRDYQGDVQVNAGIAATLRGDKNEDFWWLNNGVTIVASKATQSGKAITIENPNVVNGLQTSTEIWKYFTKSNTEKEDRSIQVKILVPAAPQSRDRIIKATNSQTQIPSISLRATEKIHRDIENYLGSFKLYYDRRKNFYKNEGKPIEKIVSINQLAQTVMAVLLRRPNDARARPSSLLKSEDDYQAVFSDAYPIAVYKVCAELNRRIEKFVKSDVAKLEPKDRNNLKFYLAMYAVHKEFTKSSLSADDMSKFDVATLTDEKLSGYLNEIQKEYAALGGSDQAAKGREMVDRLLAKLPAGKK